MSLDAALVLDHLRRLLLRRLASSGFALLSVVAVGDAPRGAAARRSSAAEHLHDLGKLLFAFTAFWAYIALLAVLPDLVREPPRGDDLVPRAARRVLAWRSRSLLAVGHFVVPFFFLMARTSSGTPATLAVGGGVAPADALRRPLLAGDADLHPEGASAGSAGDVGGAPRRRRVSFLGRVGWLLRRQPARAARRPAAGRSRWRSRTSDSPARRPRAPDDRQAFGPGRRRPRR